MSGDPANEGLAKRLLRDHLASLEAKLRAGGRLTRDDLRLAREEARNGNGVHAPSAAGCCAKSQAELARALGVSRSAVTLWLRVPGNPGKVKAGFPVVAWRDWAAARREDSRVTSGTSSGLKSDYLRLRNALLERELGVASRDYVPVADVRAWGAELGAGIRRTVLRLHMKAPNLAGLSIPEIEAQLRDAETEILGALSTLGTHIEAVPAGEPPGDGVYPGASPPL